MIGCNLMSLYTLSIESTLKNLTPMA